MAKKIENLDEFVDRCSKATVHKINAKIEKEGAEQAFFEIEMMRQEASEYTAKQQAAEKIEARKYDHKIYKG